MNKPAKKPAVVAKTAPKKRGRPAGTKNKPKVIKMTKVQVDLAKKLGLTIEQYAKELSKVTKKHIAPVDWEKLAKNLQTALATEMKQNEVLEELLQHYNDEAMRVRTLWERIVTLFTGRV